jgi:hypothetical protein
MTQETALQQAITRIKELQSNITSSSQQLGLAMAMDILEELKPLEKKQIIDAFSSGAKLGNYYLDIEDEQYYNETFKTTKQINLKH